MYDSLSVLTVRRNVLIRPLLLHGGLRQQGSRGNEKDQIRREHRRHWRNATQGECQRNIAWDTVVNWLTIDERVQEDSHEKTMAPRKAILQQRTENFHDHYSLGKELGRGQFGTTYHCREKKTGDLYACKLIPKYKCHSDEDREDVRREVSILHHVTGHPNIVSMQGAFEDRENVYIVMEACTGGELFDDIIQRGSYTEREAADIFRTMLNVVSYCHSMGVMHRDIKPENFLLSEKSSNANLKATDFGMSVFCTADRRFYELVGSPYYIAPEVLRKDYSVEADNWSLGIILYILLTGIPPFFGSNDREIFDNILSEEADFESEPWPHISEGAKDCARRLLARNPKERMSAQDALNHPWVQEGGTSQEVELGNAVVNRMMRFQRFVKFKKFGLFALAQTLSAGEVEGLKEMFKVIFCPFDTCLDTRHESHQAHSSLPFLPRSAEH